MISSTSLDLPKCREQVRLACERCGFAPRDMMEHLKARNADPVSVSLEMVERSDVYILIVAHRYGWTPDGSDISITEMEYDKAIDLDKPRLIFFIDEDHPVKPSEIEKGPGAEKLAAWKARIGPDRVAAFYTDAKSLRGEAMSALPHLITDERSDTERAQAAIHRKGAIPAAPAEYVAHPYTLLQSRDLVGRQSELRLLTDWVSEPASAVYGARIFNLIAIGGMGKSALTWKWFREIAPQEMPDLAGRMWWSFYESDATFWNFMLHALAYVSGEDVADLKKAERAEVERRLFHHLDTEPHLIVMDGLERAMIAYASPEASRMLDDDLDEETENFLAGDPRIPEGAAQSFLGRGKSRRMLDPRDGAFLQKLAQARGARILISSRLYPTELQSRTWRPRPGCFLRALPGLSEDDALALWRALGVSGARAELGVIFESVKSHPLLIHALAAEVAEFREAPGDFGVWRKANPDFDVTGLDLKQSRTHILDYALRGLDGPVREVLEFIVTFNRPASFDSLKDVLIGEGRPCADYQALDAALTELEDRGLVGWDQGANRYDAHPIVRGVVWGLIGAADREDRLTVLEAHFEPMETPWNWMKVESLEDLAPAIERYHMLVGLGRLDDAYRLFKDRIDDASFYRLGAYRDQVTWLSPFFPNGFDEAPALTGPKARRGAMNDLALAYQFSGRPGAATALYRNKAVLDEAEGDEVNLAIGLENLGDCLVEVAAFREAEAALRRALDLARKLDDQRGEGVALKTLGRALLHLNDSDRTSRVLAAADNLDEERKDKQARGLIAAYQAVAQLAAGAAEAAAARAAAAWDLAGDQRVARDLAQAALLQGRAALALGDEGAAEAKLSDALIRAREKSLVEVELPAQIALSRLALVRGDAAAAREGLAEVWAPAVEGPYPIHLADARNLEAEIEIAAGDRGAAARAATEAYEAAWCDGPPYAYHWGLEAAKGHLAALGAPEPEMPAFDESKFEPLPEVEPIPEKYREELGVIGWAPPEVG